MNSDKNQKVLPLTPYMAYDDSVSNYTTTFGHLSPYRYSNFQRESLSWKNFCYLHGGLNPSMAYLLKGKGALNLLKDNCVNTFEVFEIGSTRHAIMCNSQGNIMADGLVLHIAENEFMTYFLSPYIDYLVSSSKHEVSGKDVSSDTFLFQIGGPKSLEVVEEVLENSIHDLEFFKHRPVSIPGIESAKEKDFRVLRAGVAGTLAYEIHGDIRYAKELYSLILEKGKPFEIEPIGMEVYGMNHTENGFYQSFLHFSLAYLQHKDFMKFLGKDKELLLGYISGSAGPERDKRYCNPVEAGWADRIVFDHDFVGRDVIEKAFQSPKRKIVTLEWDKGDILDIYSSFFESDEPYLYMNLPANDIWTANNSEVVSDDVYVGNSLIGISSGRIYSYYSRKMVSLCLIEVEHSAPGQIVEVVWGDPGSKQKRIKAIVAKFPHLDLPRNKDFDLSSIPDKYGYSTL